jgi:uncharacterized protein
MLEKHHGELTEGCKRCFKGEKLVLFITGACPRNCAYCPLSEERKNKDTVFVNEWETRSIDDCLKEAEESGATGAGITGGDPLARIDRTIQYITAFKKHFGKKFHIHLYTSLDLLFPQTISRLKEAGLDELRVHPDLENETLWSKLELLKNCGMETCIEIPAFPDRVPESFKLIIFAKDFVDAFNLNELEYADLKSKEYDARGWKSKPDYSIEGSRQVAQKIME